MKPNPEVLHRLSNVALALMAELLRFSSLRPLRSSSEPSVLNLTLY